MIKLKLSEPKTVSIPVNLPDGIEFTLTARTPSYEERCADFSLMLQRFDSESANERASAHVARSVSQLSLITGWKDVCDEDGNEIPFSQANLRQLLISVPEAEPAVMIEIGKLIKPDSVQLKKPDAPEVNSAPAPESTNSPTLASGSATESGSQQ